MVEMLILDGIVPLTEDIPLKKLMNDSFKAKCFFLVMCHHAYPPLVPP
jgi:hypothetical protein